MTKEHATSLIWDYMHMGHELKKADVIILLGSIDPRVGDHAARLWHEGWAPYLAITGDGTEHQSNALNNPYDGKTEAEMLSAVVLKAGVPEDVLILENRANNTGQNYEFTIPLLKERGINTDTIIVVQKPYMERRAYATGKVWLPESEIILTSPDDTFDEYIADAFDPDDIINIMLGDLQRIKQYPKLGFQIKQDIPDDVWEAFQYLVSLGYTKHLL